MFEQFSFIFPFIAFYFLLVFKYVRFKLKVNLCLGEGNLLGEIPFLAAFCVTVTLFLFRGTREQSG